jgi:hypothetical protein
LTVSAYCRRRLVTFPAWIWTQHAIVYRAVKVFVVFTDLTASICGCHVRVAYVTGGASGRTANAVVARRGAPQTRGSGRIEVVASVARETDGDAGAGETWEGASHGEAAAEVVAVQRGIRHDVAVLAHDVETRLRAQVVARSTVRAVVPARRARDAVRVAVHAIAAAKVLIRSAQGKAVGRAREDETGSAGQ